MAINFTRLFTTLGLLAGALNEVNTYRGTTLASRRSTLRTQFATALSVYDPYITELTENQLAASVAEDTYVSQLKTLAEATIIAEVKADRPLVSETKASALAELRRQMLLPTAQTLNDCPSTVTVADVGTPTGAHAFVATLYESETGLKSDFFVPDVYLIRCTADRSNGGTAFAETFSVIGKPADSLPSDATYPTGTGIDTTITAIDPAEDQGLVTNGDFDTFVTNTPSGWTLRAGTTAGTHVFEKGSDDVRGTAASNKSLRLLSTNSAVYKLYQEVTVEALTSYIVQFRLKKVADPGTDWGVSLRLVDSSGTALAGPGSYVNLITSATAGSVAADWTNVVTGQFITPVTIPTTGVFLELVFHQFTDIAVAPANTAEVYVDHVVMFEADDPLYAAGPRLMCFSGIAEAVVGDTRTATVALASGVPSTYLIRGIDRLIGLASEDDRIPTVAGGTETQADALVT